MTRITRLDLVNLEQKILAERRARGGLTPAQATALRLIDHYRKEKGWADDSPGGDNGR